MRGFPLLRTILVLIGLCVFGFGLFIVTSSRTRAIPPPPEKALHAAISEIPYHFDLSAPASEIAVGFNDAPTSAALSGNLVHSSDDTYLSVRVRWQTAPAAGQRRFAKLTLSPPGKPTITHVFDSAGDIDDILELP